MMSDRIDYRAVISRFHSLIALLLMVLAFSVFADGFLSVDNFWTVMRQISVNTCLSVGMTLVILTGGIDLSVGSILALSGAVMAGLLKSGTELETLNLYVGYGAPGRCVPWLVQWRRDHAVQGPAVCGDVGHADHRPGADEAIYGR